MRKPAVAFAIVVTLVSSIDLLHAWGGQGHRLVGLIAADRLTAATIAIVIVRASREWTGGRAVIGGATAWSIASPIGKSG